MSDFELRDELMTLLAAGHETTATALSWCFERLTRSPAVFARLHEAVCEGDDSYLEAVVFETLRLRPVLPFVARLLKAPFEVGEWELPAGVTVAPCIYLLHRRADLYPDPKAFRPERFLDEPPGTYTWIPFGGGPRRCLGASFALLEMKVILRTILEGAELRAAEPQSEPIRNRNITFAPKNRTTVVLDRLLPRRAARATTSQPVAAGRKEEAVSSTRGSR
jgi:cytochrome P450